MAHVVNYQLKLRVKKYVRDYWTKGELASFYWNLPENTRTKQNDLKQLDAFLINYSLLWKPEFLFVLDFICNRKTQSTIRVLIQKLGTLS